MKVNYQNKPMHAVKMYDKLRDEWMANNPNHSDEELLKTCIELAKVCRLNLRNDLNKLIQL